MANTGEPMPNEPLFKAAFPYQDDLLGLPVKDLDSASQWYSKVFDLKEVERRADPYPTVILERDGVQFGFAVNGGDPEQAGAAILVSDIHRAKEEVERGDAKVGDLKVDKRDGKRFHVFFVVAPDGLCYYFHQPI